MSPRIVLSGVCVVTLTVSACSTTQSVNVPNCGPEIEQKDVIVGDLRPLKNREDEIPAYLEAHLGSYTVMSEQPLLIEKTGNHRTVFESTGLATLRASKAGCNLVLVMDEAGRPSTVGSAGSISGRSSYWAVEFGTFELPAPGLPKPVLPDP